MSARTGMANLIAELRALTEAGTADYTLGTVVYWSDDEIQTALDRTQNYWRTRQLVPLPIVVGAGTPIYRDYGFPDEIGYWIEDPSGGSTVWQVHDYTGNIISSSLYSVNLNARRITFSANQFGSACFLDCFDYDLDRAAADIWTQKAAHVGQRVDWQSDNHRVSASHLRQQAFEMARYYKGLAGVQFTAYYRTDEN